MGPFPVAFGAYPASVHRHILAPLRTLLEHQMIRLLLAAPIPFYLESLEGNLAAIPEFLIVAAESDAEGTVVSARRTRPAVALIDVGMAGAMEAIRFITTTLPDTRVVAGAVPETEEDILRYAGAGAFGYVPVDAGFDDLLVGLRSVARGEFCCPRRVVARLFRHLALRPASEFQKGQLSSLTLREIQIGKLLEQGRRNQEIADALNIELGTAKNHLHNLFTKLQVKSRGEAVARLRLYRGSHSE
jgi:two-component system, NarL family, nitrate/nitrite response regulator NarL